ncbi:MAG TPA: DUF3291 domain-containing protein [Terriglobia bacterium]|nr:DUF3291 domain-containing protein [Terriglobia bacterium]
MEFHLAQANIAWMHGALHEPVMSGLASRVDEINRLAEESPGFVWRLPGSEVRPEALHPFETDFPGFHRDRLFYNMSVWLSLEHLRSYTFFSAHAELLNERHQWVDSIVGASVALWWIPADHRPDIAESADRLRSVRRTGPTPYAFTMRKAFPPPRSRE